MPRTLLLRSRCFCGALTAELRTTHSPARLPLRSCTCSFCTKHGARNTSDPAGRARIRIRRAARLSRFDWRAERGGRLICAHCGVYVGMALKIGGKWYASLNVNAFERSGEFRQAAVEVDYSGETAAESRERRVTRWTPAEVRGDSTRSSS